MPKRHSTRLFVGRTKSWHERTAQAPLAAQHKLHPSKDPTPVGLTGFQPESESLQNSLYRCNPPVLLSSVGAPRRSSSRKLRSVPVWAMARADYCYPPPPPLPPPNRD